MKGARKVFIFSVILLMSFSLNLFAGDPVTKLSRGLTNVATSPMEFYNQYVLVSGDRDPFLKFFETVFYGTASTLERIVVGAYEVVTFAVPVPAGYAPVIIPETPLTTTSQTKG
ncbi:MAG: exosortase system-associated protein, TIGR04073 family [Candidatus Omnitrophota bacterium]|jgi:putative exosortase-associated protein (TIGR04073 family)